LTFRSLSIPESQFSKTWRRKAILRGKGDSGLSYSGLDEIPVCHLTETEKSRKVNLIRQSHLTSPQTKLQRREDLLIENFGKGRVVSAEN
jgi:hypothetical protein